MQRKQFVIGPVNVNCNIVYSDKTRECIIIDPGGYEKQMNSIIKWIKHTKLNVKKILITHGHLDHILGIVPLHNSFPEAKVFIHKEDLFLYNAIESQCGIFGLLVKKKLYNLPTPNHFEHEEELEMIEGMEDKSLIPIVLHTPGHSPGSSCFHFKEENILFSGDTLFRFNIGRTDLMGGSFNSIISSINNRLYQLHDNTLVIPGHGEQTTIGEEKINNLFTNNTTVDTNQNGTIISANEANGHQCLLCERDTLPLSFRIQMSSL